jgi:hypothetical protein
MTDAPTQLTEEQVAHANANIDLISEFVQEFLELPDDAELFPEGANVVFLPPEDRDCPSLVAMNLRIARKLAAEGKTVWIWTIGSGKATPLEDYEALLATEPIQH